MSSGLDYYNSLFNGMMDWWPSSVQNAAARLVSGARPSRRCYARCIQFRFGSGWTSRRPPWSTVRCPAWLRHTCPLTVSCRLKKVVVSCVLPTRGLVSTRQVDLYSNFGDRCFAAAGPQPSSWS